MAGTPCFQGEFDALRQVAGNYYDIILCNNEKNDKPPCADTDLNVLYYRILNTSQKRDFIDHLVGKYEASETEMADRIKKTFQEQFKGQYHLVRIMSHYYEQTDSNFPQIDPQMAIAGTQISPQVQSQDQCIASAKQSVKKRGWDGLMNGGKQVSDNTIVAPLEKTGILVVESYICVPIVKDQEVSSFIEKYTEGLLDKQMGGRESTKEFVPAIPGL
jgi:hypothetical protein